MHTQQMRQRCRVAAQLQVKHVILEYRSQKQKNLVNKCDEVKPKRVGVAYADI
jgi:hypothetical protein